jgi:hypothetical protein
MPLWLSLPIAAGLVFGLASLLSTSKARASSSPASGGSVTEVAVEGRHYIVTRAGELVTVVRKDKPHVFVIFRGDEIVASGPENDDDMVELGIDLDTIAQHAQGVGSLS